MSATNDKKVPIDAAVIVFGTAKGAKLPQAGWFRAKDSQAAMAAALKFGLAILHVDTDAVRASLPALREAQVKLGTDTIIPVIDTTLLQRLVSLHKDASKLLAGLKVPPLGGSSAAKIPPTEVGLWNALQVGSLVVAADMAGKNRPDDWYVAEILEIDGDTFTIRFPDYPDDGKVKLARRYIALLYPQG